ncbi:MAG: EAL domain-containing protein [Nevskia sp.]|nr:EAL domain-containing protein [Nevskia sp.]
MDDSPATRRDIRDSGGLMRRLRLGHKVLLGGVLLAIPTAAMLYFFTAAAARAVDFTARERCGLAYHTLLRQLVEQAPAPATDSAAAVEALFGRIAALERQPCVSATVHDQLDTDSEVDLLRQAWRTAVAAGDPASLRGFELRVLALQSEIADKSGMTLDYELDTYYTADLLLIRFPAILQAMPYGGDSPEQITADAALLTRQLTRLTRNLSVAAAHNTYHPGSRGTLQRSIGASTEQFETALRNLLHEMSPAAAPGQGLEAARVTARRALFALYDATAAWHERALAARIADEHRYTRGVYLVVAALMLLACAFARLAVRDSVTRLMDLVGLSRRMARGELKLTVDARGTDEVAMLGKAFNAMAADLDALYRSIEQEVRDRTAAANAAEERFRRVVEFAPSAIVLVNDRGEIVLINAQAELLFGYARNELLGKPVDVLVPERVRAFHAGTLASYFAEPRSRAMGSGRALYALRKDGREVPIDVGLSPLQDEGRYVLASVIDITERKQAEATLRAAEVHALRSSILDSLPVAVIATDNDGNIVAVNPAAESLLGYARQELLGQSCMLVYDPDDMQRRAHELSNKLGFEVGAGFQVMVALGSQNAADEREWTYIQKDGTRVPVNVAITALRDDSGKVTGFLKVAYDITVRKRAEAYIRHMAQHDALTGLPNRTLLLDRLEMAMHQARRHDHQVAVLLMDLDQFKRVNDTLGHLVGDRLLLTVANRLQRCVRSVDTVARLGGDEFVVVVTEVQRREDLQTLLHELTRAVSQTIVIDGHELHVTPSIGACLSPQDGLDSTTLLQKADTAMYHAKAAGRSNAQWFTEEMLVESREKLTLGSALRQAMSLEQMYLAYQPEVSLVTGRITGVEALLRWTHPQLGTISPQRFIPVAEETGMILRLGEWVLRRACVECVALQRQLNRALTLAVNVSPRQFLQKDWIDIVRSALADSGLNPNQLELEITESTLMQNPEDAAAMLREIRSSGVGIVVDDFGTGYSSLSYITRFPIDKLKIDRTFVRDLTTDATDAAVINAIVAMAQRLRIRVIAEGVENEEQQRYLIDQGCEEAQGFHYSEALSTAALVQAFDGIEAAIHVHRRDDFGLAGTPR